jgi:hypothetical protein
MSGVNRIGRRGRDARLWSATRGVMSLGVEALMLLPFLLTSWFGMEQLMLVQMAGAVAAHAANNAGRAAMVAPGPDGLGLEGVRDAAVHSLAAMAPMFDEMGAHTWSSVDGMEQAIRTVEKYVQVQVEGNPLGAASGAQAEVRLVFLFPCRVPFGSLILCEGAGDQRVARIERSVSVPVHARERL